MRVEYTDTGRCSEVVMVQLLVTVNLIPSILYHAILYRDAYTFSTLYTLKNETSSTIRRLAHAQTHPAIALNADV